MPVSKPSINDLILGEIALRPFLIELPILANIPLSENVLGNALAMDLNPSAILGTIPWNSPPNAVKIPLNTPNFWIEDLNPSTKFLIPSVILTSISVNLSNPPPLLVPKLNNEKNRDTISAAILNSVPRMLRTLPMTLPMLTKLCMILWF